MLVTGLDIGSFVRVRGLETTVGQPRSVPGAPGTVDWAARGAARSDLLQAVRAVDELARLLELGRRGAAEPPQATSTSDIGLDPSPATAATLGSVEEVNATPTSFSTYAPAWTGASSAAIVLDGEYDGSNGTDTLTFDVRRGGTHGVDNLRIEVNDGAGKRIDFFNIQPADPIDQVYTLSNGMTFTLGAGNLSKNDTLTVDVFDSVGTAVDPDRPLDGTGADDARLESTLPVGPGSFTVNGVNIDVFAGDSLNDVLARIDASAAGVSAVFDSATERVLLTQKTPGSVPSIVLGPDSSGFLAATKLDSAVVTPGTDHEPSLALAQLPEFVGVSSGTVTVNGVDTAFDVNTDSLLDVLARIEGGAANVTATLAPSAQRVTIANNDPSRDLTLGDPASGLLAALHIDAKTYPALVLDNRIAKTVSYRAADALEALRTSMDRLMRADLGQRDSALAGIQSGLGNVLSATREGVGDRMLSRFGVNMRAAQGRPTRLALDADSRARFTGQLQRDVAPLQDLMLGERGSAAGGLLGGLRTVLESAIDRLRATDPVGAFVNLSA